MLERGLRLSGNACKGDNPGARKVLLTVIFMIGRASTAILSLLLMFHGCSDPSIQLKYKAAGASPELLAVYEGWFGEPGHISVGYSSHDSDEIRKQISKAQGMGISAFVVDWYGDRDQYVDQSYALVQKLAAKKDFHVAMMYDEGNDENGATDVAIADFTTFHETYLSPKSPGHEAYLTFDGRPVIFLFPKSGHTDWEKVRATAD
jgi:hypothetical protein